MQQFQTTGSRVALPNASNSPDAVRPRVADKVVPDSFAEWLAQPARTITSGPEPEQGVFAALLNDSRASSSLDQSAKIGRP
jgi:hypothetical protein